MATRPNGTTSEYTYDPLTGWTEAITHKRGGNVLLALGYDRDKTGLITDIAETRPAGEQSGAWHYGYDTLKRLSGATWTPSAGAATSYGYTYDRNGNRLSESVTGSSTKYSRYNKLDQLLDERTGVAHPGGTIEKSYTWDTHGRLSSESGVGVSPAIDRLYTWSVDDRLESVRLGPNTSDPTVRYTYDHDGRLIKREKGQDVARFLVDNDNPTGYSQALAEVNADATKTTENYYYGDDFGPLAQVHNPGAAGFDQRFLYGDHLSTTRLLDSALASDSYHYYTPFGNQTGPSTPLSAFAFTGQYRDIDSGLQYHRARWNSPANGRFNSVDPMEGSASDPYTMLKYPYCRADSVNCADPPGSSFFYAWLGRIVHVEMELKYVLAAAPQVVWPELNIRVGGPVVIRPDLLNVTLGEVYEIKPLSQYGLETGIAQMTLYLLTLNSLRFAGRFWGPGITYIPFSLNPIPGYPTFWFIELGNLGGILTYKIVRAKNATALLSALIPLAIFLSRIKMLTGALRDMPELLDSLIDVEWDIATARPQIARIVVSGLALACLSMAAYQMNVALSSSTLRIAI